MMDCLSPTHHKSTTPNQSYTHNTNNTHEHTQKLYAKLRARFSAPDAKLVFEGDVIPEDETPEGLDLEDEDMLDVKGV